MIIHHDPRDGVALAAFRSEWWPASRRNSGRLQIGNPGRLRRNTHTDLGGSVLAVVRLGDSCIAEEHGPVSHFPVANDLTLATELCTRQALVDRPHARCAA